MQTMRTYWWGDIGNLDSGQVIQEHPRDDQAVGSLEYIHDVSQYGVDVVLVAWYSDEVRIVCVPRK